MQNSTQQNVLSIKTQPQNMKVFSGLQSALDTCALICKHLYACVKDRGSLENHTSVNKQIVLKEGEAMSISCQDKI